MRRDFISDNPTNCVVKMQVRTTQKMHNKRISNVGSEYNQRTLDLNRTKSPLRCVATNPSQPRLRFIHEQNKALVQRIKKIFEVTVPIHFIFLEETPKPKPISQTEIPPQHIGTVILDTKKRTVSGQTLESETVRHFRLKID